MPRTPKNWKHRGVSKKQRQLTFDWQSPLAAGTIPLGDFDLVNEVEQANARAKARAMKRKRKK